jgi:hypothetical protein
MQLLGDHIIGYTKQLITVAGKKSVITSYECSSGEGANGTLQTKDNCEN